MTKLEPTDQHRMSPAPHYNLFATSLLRLLELAEDSRDIWQEHKQINRRSGLMEEFRSAILG